ncbi:protein NPAT [Aplochiton taeniatus]
MLLPSDVARLVLGYLQQEGLCNSSRTFIHESPNLKEYAEHSTEDGTIPACVFSLLGKNLTTILNEYVAAKTKETNQEIPLVMTSLWKKLDITISQIKSMQNSLRPVGLQTRSPNGMTTLRQRALTHSPVVLSTSTPQGGPTTISPSSLTAHRMPVNSTPINYTFQQYRTTPIAIMQTPVPDPEPRVQTDIVSRDFPVQIVVPDSRFANPSPMSPGRRKWDSPRRRGGALSGSSGLGRANASAGSLGTEPQTEDSAANENFPQLVIQNAREKILGDRSLQEKLAENINKILSSDTSLPHTLKATCSAMDPDPSIDEILGLQGEIHMSNDAIQDILEQTESDPAFQALFDLFECGKNKTSGDANQGDESVSGSPVEGDMAEPASDNIPTEAGEQGVVCEDTTTAQDVPTQMPGRSGLEAKTKKPRKSAPSSSSKTIPTSCSARGLRRDTSQARLSPSKEKQAADSDRGDAEAGVSDDGAAMDIDEPSSPPPCPPAPHRTTPQGIPKPPRVEGRLPQPALETSNTAVIPAPKDSSVIGPTPVFATSNSVLSATRTGCDVSKVGREKPQEALATGDTNRQTKQTPVECEAEILTALPPPTLGSAPSVALVKPVANRSKKVATPNVSIRHGNTTVVPGDERVSPSQTGSATSGLAGSTANTNSPSATTATASPATASVPLSSTPSRNASEDPNKIMTLNIIISDDQEEASPRSNTALHQAVSSISSDRIPTIFLSSPAKPPVNTPDPPSAVSVGQDETAQAVSGLQQSTAGPQAPATELDPLGRGKAGAMETSAPLVGVTAPTVVPQNNVQLTQGHPGDLPQPSYILQLPLDSTNRTFPGATTSYFLVTDPSAGEHQARQVLVSTGVQGQAGPLTSATPYVAATPPRSQAYPTGPAVFFTSPSKPLVRNVVLPVPVVGQNHPGRFQLLSNQLVAMPSPGPLQQSEPVKPTPTQPASKDTAVSNPLKKSESRRKSRSVVREDVEESKVNQSERSRSLSSDLRLRSGSRKEKEETARRKPSEKGSAKTREGRPEKKTTVEPPKITANKENEVERARLKEKEQEPSTSTSAPREFSPPPPLPRKPPTTPKGTTSKPALKSPPKHLPKTPPKPLSKTRSRTPSKAPSKIVSKTSPRIPSKTSPLIKAAEMLHDIQPPSTPPKRPAVGCQELPLPRTPGSGTGRLHEDPLDFTRTPTRQRPVRDGEGTPRHLVPPATPELPTCSPASEAGSENSINMAAHTLMILSRAAISRTGTPLKDSLRQEGAGGAKSPLAQKSKKRKQLDPPANPPAKKESRKSGTTGSKKKEKKQSKLLDSFPDDLDVDKFLSSLHYDE